jgi:Protein of unknown function (DUF3634)
VSIRAASPSRPGGATVVNSLILLALVVPLGWGLVAALRPHALFVIRINQGVPRAARGQVTRGFLQDVAETCARHGLRSGEIRGIAAGRRIALSFSWGIPEPCRQQIRNLWNLSGWSVPGPTRPRRTA